MAAASGSQQEAHSASGDPLSERDEHMLRFERQWWRHAGAKEEAIRLEFGLSAARYYQVLNAVLDLPGSMIFDPMLVKRLQRTRDARTEARSARTLGTAEPHTTN